MQLDTVYINLDKRVDRRKLIQGEMKQQGLKGRRFSAKSGDDVKDSQVARSWHSRLNCLYDKKTIPAEHTMSKGERGCSGSHLALWKQCAKRDDPSKPMLILEDDAVLWDRSGVAFPELCHRLIAAVEQLYDVEKDPVMLYVGCEVSARWPVAHPYVSMRAQATRACRPDRLSPSHLAPPRFLLVSSMPAFPLPAPSSAFFDGIRALPQVVRWRDQRRVIVEGPPQAKLREAEYLWQTSSYILWPAAAKELLSHLPIDSPTDCYISKLVLEGRCVCCPFPWEPKARWAVDLRCALAGVSAALGYRLSPSGAFLPCRITAVVATPALAEQRDPYAKGDIKHTNIYNWDEAKVQKAKEKEKALLAKVAAA